MASRSLLSDRDSPPVNGTEQPQTDLFQNLEKLIASAVSICRLDGSVQCQIGGLITVIEELQRLLRQSFAEIKRLERSVDDQRHAFTMLEQNQDAQKNTFTRLERNLDDQQHMFTNNITNLHYQVKEVQYNVETLKCQMKDADKCKETENVKQQSNPNDTVDKPAPAPLADESYGYSEESDVASIPNNPHVDKTEIVDHPIEGKTENDKAPEDAMDVTSETDTTQEQPPVPMVDKETCMVEGVGQVAFPDSLPYETPSPNIQTSPPNETATSTTEERENALRVLRSTSDRPTQEASEGKNNSLEGIVRNLRMNAQRDQSTLPSKKSPHNTRKTSPKNTNVFQRVKPASKASLGKKALVRNAVKSKANPLRRSAQRSPRRQITPKRSGRTVVSSKVKKLPTRQASQRNKLTQVQRKGAVGINVSRKSTDKCKDIKKNAIVKSSKKQSSPLKLRNGARLSRSHSKTDQSNTKANNNAANQRVSMGVTANEKRPKANEESKESVTAGPLSENPMDKYIDLDFLLNANQLMSELVTDASREEGTLDTASEAERRHIVDLAKLYRLRVRMAGKEGELPVALIKGRESSLPQPGQVDKLLHKMTHVMVLKSKESAKKHKLKTRRSLAASPAKKRRF